MTFSLLASDGEDWGMAIATARSAVGGRCALLGEYGVVATQGMVSTRVGHDVAQRMIRGETPEAAIRASLGGDDRAKTRQVLALAPDGTNACWSGSDLPGWAGYLASPGVVAAGNTLTSQKTVRAMVDTFGETSGSLGQRIVDAMAAGQAAGGDRRGRQSACLLVGRGDPWPTVDLRVDDHRDPIDELRRILRLWEAEWGVYDATGAFPAANPPTR